MGQLCTGQHAQLDYRLTMYAHQSRRSALAHYTRRHTMQDLMMLLPHLMTVRLICACMLLVLSLSAASTACQLQLYKAATAFLRVNKGTGYARQACDSRLF